MALRLQLTSGLEILEEWAESARQAERNVVYEALFAVGDGSAFIVYDIFADPGGPGDFIVVVRPGLVVRIRVQRAESAFEIRYVGAFEESADTPGVQTERDQS